MPESKVSSKKQKNIPGRSPVFLLEMSLGVLFFLCLLKFGTPVIMDKYMIWPANVYEWVLNLSWPFPIAWGAVIIIGIIGIFAARKPSGLSPILIALPVAWFLWQLLAAVFSVAPDLTLATLFHFAGSMVCFYAGLLGLGQAGRIPWLCLALIAGLFLVLATGLEQHFGGLEESQKYWQLYVYPTLREVPPGLMKKMTSTRIFSTLFYPNALAGAILLVLPVVLGALWDARKAFTVPARLFLMSCFALAAMACLFWSGSKAGWLIFLLLGIAFILSQPVSRRVKTAVVLMVILVGLSGFTIRYLGFFKKGATSVVARYDYWQAALEMTVEKPFVGNGPGAFGKGYARHKRPESEMAQLTHNDYLQQAADSGIPGCLFFTSFVVWAMFRAHRNIRLAAEGGMFRLAVWLGLLGWTVQSTVEFGLYIPAIGWLGFALLGWLLAQPSIPNGMDKPALNG